MSRSARAVAPSNIALVKYWGKRDGRLNLPAMGSLSVSLRNLETQSQVTFLDEEGDDEIFLDGQPVNASGVERVGRMLEVLRAKTEVQGRARIESSSNFPVGAGIASSASGMAAVALAASAAAGWKASREEVSALARLGSGSACRSIFGGYVEWRKGVAPGGEDSHGVEVAPYEYWELDVLVAVVDSGPKKISSGKGMVQSARTSSFYPAWVAGNEPDLESARTALSNRDFEALGQVTESSALKMHATMMTGSPSILYWRPGTLEVLEWMAELRASGVSCFFTMDAGPNVKLFFPPGESVQWQESLKALPSVERVILSSVGPGGAVTSHGV